MTEYIIKSTVSLVVLYLMYYSILRNQKSFEFNRFYLLFAVIFSLTIPFVQFTTEIKLPFNQNINDYSYTIQNITKQSVIGNEATYNTNNSTLIHLNFLVNFYLFISSVLLIRFVFNFYKIIKSIKNSQRIEKSSPVIVLCTTNSLPYSFFNYIIVNKVEYKTGNVNNDLILHEQVHCKQKHSIDILLIEIIKIIFWLNPVLWIIKKEIQLNHEYLADKNVLQSQNVMNYQNTLLNLVLRNNSTYLASDFNYSLTKKRLMMMTKKDSLIQSMAHRIVMIPLVLILAVSMTYSQKELSIDSLSSNNNMSYSDEWWYPLLQKHNIELLPFNNFGSIFEMGETNEVTDNIVYLKNATLLLDDKKANAYSILKADNVIRDMHNKTIKATNNITITSFNYNDYSPTVKIESGEVELSYDENGRANRIKTAPGTKKTKGVVYNP